jgi:hypothetical protein
VRVAAILPDARGAEEALAKMRQVMQRLRLTVNEENTHICRVSEQYFEFLGYEFGRFYSERTGKAAALDKIGPLMLSKMRPDGLQDFAPDSLRCGR